MKKRTMKTFHWLLLATMVLGLAINIASCSGDDDSPVEQGRKKFVIPDSTFCEVTVVFAPGQLGDKGYADNVMEGINKLSYLDNNNENVGLDVHFISPRSFRTLSNAVREWALDSSIPYADGKYRRRLLVLTEPFMFPMVATVSHYRETDEVLLLKANDDDVIAAAEKNDMGHRVYGLNISAARSIRRFCRFMEEEIVRKKERFNRNVLNKPLMYQRLYDSELIVYRDSVYETLAEELGESNISVSDISSEMAEGLYTKDLGNTVVEYAYMMAVLARTIYNRMNLGFYVNDLGSGNSGWDYWLMGFSQDDDIYQTLIIDSSESPLFHRYYVKREFGDALADWCVKWAKQENDTMPRFTLKYGDAFCVDNLPVAGE